MTPEQYNATRGTALTVAITLIIGLGAAGLTATGS